MLVIIFCTAHVRDSDFYVNSDSKENCKSTVCDIYLEYIM